MKKRVKVLRFEKAIEVSLSRKMNERGITDKTKKEDVCRLNSFITKHYNASLGLVGSIQAYLNNLRTAGRSASYIRRMRWLLGQFMAYLPTCQLSMFSGVTL
jgi:hypothetical protein